MICPYCKHEKLQDPVCPNCNLDEKAALRQAADLYWTEGKEDLAADYYGRYLDLEPADFEVACKRATYLCAMARNRRDLHLFEKADGQLNRILEGHWDWKEGHQNRVDLYFCFGGLGALQDEYRKVAEQEPGRAEMCRHAIELIRLVLRFNEERPQVAGDFNSEGELARFLKSFWPLLLGIAFFWAFSIWFPAPPPSQGEAARRAVFFRQGLVSLSLLGLGLLGMWHYKKGHKGRRKSRPPLAP